MELKELREQAAQEYENTFACQTGTEREIFENGANWEFERNKWYTMDVLPPAKNGSWSEDVLIENEHGYIVPGYYNHSTNTWVQRFGGSKIGIKWAFIP